MSASPQPFKIGDTLNAGRYTITRRHSDSVWIASDLRISRNVSIKLASYSQVTEILRRLASGGSEHQGRFCIAKVLDYFRHNGTQICVVFEAFDDDLPKLVKHHKPHAPPLSVIKQITTQLLSALDWLHRCCGVVHGDIRPENIFVASYTSEKITVKIGNFESAGGSSSNQQASLYSPPESILDCSNSPNPSTDIWSLGCIIFELLTGGDHLFNPHSGRKYSKNEDHLAQIIELLGPLPLTLTQSSTFFNKNGDLINISGLSPWSLEAVLREKYRFSESSAEKTASFLGLMLHPDPESRPTAAQLIRHSFLKISSPTSSASPGRYKKTSTASTPANSPPRQNAQRTTGWGIIDNPGEGNAGGPLGYVLGGVGSTTVLGLIGMIGGGGSLVGGIAGAAIGGIEGSMTGGGARVPRNSD